MKRIHCISLLALFCAGLSSAQETRSTIFGRVLDPHATAISGAAVSVTNTQTNLSITLTSDADGYFEANLLLPGNYHLTAEAPGFKKTIRSGITLPISTRLPVDLALALGTVTESVQVSADPPVLDTSSVSSGGLTDQRNVNDLPAQGDNPLLLAALTPGVQAGGVNKYNCLHCVGGSSDFSVSGKVGGNDFSMDGAPNSRGRSPAFLPAVDAVQEFKVETSGFDASIGHTTGASISIMTKSGSNDFHGSLSDQHWQAKWNGTPFFVKQQYFREIASAQAAGDSALANRLRSEDRQGNGRSNTFSASLGGPLTIPKVYNGKNRLFFFFNVSGYVDQKPPTYPAGATNRTVPTLANRRGDFSQLLNVDAVRYQIYDPLTVRPDPVRPGNFIRSPLVGNVVPRSRITNPAYDSYLKIIPLANNDPTDPRQEPRNNYQARRMTMDWTYVAQASRLDYVHSDKHRFFTSLNHFGLEEYQEDWTYETARGLMSQGKAWDVGGITTNWVYTISNRTLLDVSASVNNTWTGRALTKPYEYKPSDVGLPAYLDAKAGGLHVLPRMEFSGYEAVGQLVPEKMLQTLYSLKANLSHVRRSHSVRAGFDTRQYFRTAYTAGNTSGLFAFSNTYTRRNDDTLTPSGNYGHSWAAFMMGLPDTMQVQTNDSVAIQSGYFGWYVQDNWRVSPTLSINLGLRLEYEAGGRERYNRAIGDFNPAAKLQITDAAVAAYALNPLPELPASAFQVQGGTRYPGANGVSRRMLQSEVFWLPRIGVSWQVRPTTVLRGGYGVFYDTLNAFNKGFSQLGFNRTTSTNLTNDFGMNWLAGDPYNGVSPMSDPFPLRADGTRFDVPTRDGLGPMAVAGRGFTFDAFDTRRSRQQRWRIGVQQQLGTSTVLEIAYAGSYSDRVYLTRNLNGLPEQYWADGLVRNNAIASALNANVPNPFYIGNFSQLAASSPLVYKDMSTLGFFTSRTARKQQLLRPFPLQSALSQSNSPFGQVRTDALEISLQRRFSRGISFMLGYTRLNDREADFYFNEFDAAPTWRESNDGRPHRIAGTAIYELPFGKGRRFARQGPLNMLFGGFQLAATYEYQPGPLLDWGNLFYYGNIGDINSGPRSLANWFDTANFERNASRGPAAFHRRVFPTRVPGLRADRTDQWNLNAQRDFRWRERWVFSIRMDALNAMNRSQFAAPDVDPLSSTFGKITAQTPAINRVVQLTGRIRF
ncbi:MAG: carboxypeptidase regulatory-like domain-containing protein [Acidobacteria bacterium]|nr:carboxypeptidase regulatory-like domain-containing protein [Acidobacteriota bacterium]